MHRIIYIYLISLIYVLYTLLDKYRKHVTERVFEIR